MLNETQSNINIKILKKKYKLYDIYTIYYTLYIGM